MTTKTIQYDHYIQTIYGTGPTLQDAIDNADNKYIAWYNNNGDAEVRNITTQTLYVETMASPYTHIISVYHTVE